MWYEWHSGTKVEDSETGKWHYNHQYSSYSQAVWVKGGSIVPVFSHDNCDSLMQCINNPIQLKIFLDENEEASGTIYFDNGELYNPTITDNQKAHLSFKFKNNQLTTTNLLGTTYDFPST